MAEASRSRPRRPLTLLDRIGRRRARHEGSRGQAVVEFALVIPLMLIILMAIVDFARIYTTMINVESAAREAADFGTTYGAEQWSDANRDATVADMRHRACVAASNLPDYRDSDGDPMTGCDNPSFSYCVTPSVGGSCGAPNPADACDDPERASPCRVTVTLTYDFRLIAPMNINFFGVRLGLPSNITFTRDSTFAITDIEIAGP